MFVLLCVRVSEIKFTVNKFASQLDESQSRQVNVYDQLETSHSFELFSARPVSSIFCREILSSDLRLDRAVKLVMIAAEQRAHNTLTVFASAPELFLTVKQTVKV